MTKTERVMHTESSVGSAVNAAFNQLRGELENCIIGQQTLVEHLRKLGRSFRIEILSAKFSIEEQRGDAEDVFQEVWLIALMIEEPSSSSSSPSGATE